MKQISPIEQLDFKFEDPEEEKKGLEEKKGTEPHVEEVDFETMMARASEDLDDEKRLMYGHGHKK